MQSALPVARKKTAVTRSAPDYDAVLADVVVLVEAARHASARAVNALLTATYWGVGRRIVEQEQHGSKRAGYGEELIVRLSGDLQSRFGRGFGRANLFQMRAFFLAYREILQITSGELVPALGSAKVQTTSGLFATQDGMAAVAARFPLPWSHYVRLLAVRNPEARRFYEAETLRGGWTIRQLDRQIGTQFYERTALSRNKAAMLRRGEAQQPGDALTPEEEIKDPYVLEFLDLKDEYSESDLEAALIAKIESFLLELGGDFTFVGRQRRLRVGDTWYRVDLMFFHRRLELDERTCQVRAVTSRLVSVTCLSLAALGCGGTLDAGSDLPHGPLPVDERSAIVVSNDGARDNWHGEYALLLAASRRVTLAGIAVNSVIYYPDLELNVSNFRSMIQAARDSGMRYLPDATASVAPALMKPTSGVIEDTVPNHSEGARLILEAANRLGSAVHPLVIAVGGPLTDAADAYLMDPSLPEHAVVVASMGNVVDGVVKSGGPNGDVDPWATTIVVNRMRVVQVNGYYDQLLDFPETRVAELPQNPFGTWIREKRGEILDNIVACDQVSLLAAALPWFAGDVTRMRAQPGDDIPTLQPDPSGEIWHVGSSQSDRARDELWRLLQDPLTYQ